MYIKLEIIENRNCSDDDNECTEDDSYNQNSNSVDNISSNSFTTTGDPGGGIDEY